MAVFLYCPPPPHDRDGGRSNRISASSPFTQTDCDEVHTPAALLGMMMSSFSLDCAGPVADSLLKYREIRLGAAKTIARLNNYSGACIF